MLKPFAFLLCSVAIIFITSCANQVSPTGGEKDERPPHVVKSNPRNLTVNFSSDRINLTFDEYTQLADPAAQIFFSPALDGKPQYRLHGKTFSITHLGILNPNTTYSVSFGNAIKDLTEGNIMLNYQYVFSTGSYIDSFKIKGNVKDVNGKSSENLLVMLYSDLSDSAVAKHRPNYNARTDKDGNFAVDHVKTGIYKLVALNDLNFNLLYDGAGEAIAFFDSSITISDTTGFYKLTMFKPYGEKQKVISAESHQPGRILFSFFQPTQDIHVSNMSDKNATGFLEYSFARDTVTYWLNDLISDSIMLAVSDKNFSDTVMVRMKKANTSLHVSLPLFSVKTIINNFQQVASQPIVIQFSSPIAAINENKKIELLKDSLKQTVNRLEMVTDTISNKRFIAMHAIMEEKKKYTLIIPDSLFSDVYGRFNDSSLVSFSTLEKSELGNLNLKIAVADSSNLYFYEFRNKAGDLLGKHTLKTGTNNLVFTSMAPGNYYLRVIQDANRNNHWDTGDYWKHLQPEEIINYNGDISLRANWDIDIQMNISGLK
ncbi:MAG: Ig-like domain-containing protein [Chitinophagales bacterium]|nr:Ig-like domain-containing protein [Chitinophagales bacterium]